MRNRRMWGVAWVVALLMVFGMMASVQAKGGVVPTAVQATLTGPGASGTATFTTKADAAGNVDQRLKVRVQAPAFAGSTVNVLVGGILVGSMLLDAGGKGSFEPLAAPILAVQTGTLVEVETGAGALVVSGAL